jgi:diadenosine tetraphosphate (Ap4A) HIT family hydrolase
MDDARFPWLLLVPRVPGASEWVDLEGGAQRLLLAEINQASALLRRQFAPIDKLNIGALGNLVRQLHVHVVGRREGDAAWPGPVWGAGLRRPYGGQAPALASQLAKAMTEWPTIALPSP